MSKPYVIHMEATQGGLWKTQGGPAPPRNQDTTRVPFTYLVIHTKIIQMSQNPTPWKKIIKSVAEPFDNSY